MKLALSGFLVLIAVVLVFIGIAAVGPETDHGLLGPEDWPATVDEAVRDLLPRISRFEKLKIMFTKKDDTISLYFDLGAGIRNRYGLWRGNDKLILSACGYRCHPDEASMQIIEAVWQALHK